MVRNWTWCNFSVYTKLSLQFKRQILRSDKVTRSFNVRELTIPFSGDILEPIQYHGHQEIRKHLPKQKLLRILGATEIRNT